MKKCSWCKQMKSFSEFHQSKKNKYQSRCKICNKKTRIKAYQENSEREKANNRIWFAKEFEWYISLKDNPCSDCNQKFHFSAMQWDHRPGTDKVESVSRLMGGYRGRKIILEEIAKCDLVCANCHSIRTWARRNR